MTPLLNSSLAVIFLLCGTAAALIMLELRGAPKDRPFNATLIKLHRIFGWIFTGIFVLSVMVMIAKISGYKEEASPRVSFHIVLSLALIPSLAFKIIIARRYPRLSQHLIIFGPMVLILAFTLSGISAGYYFLHSSDLKYVSLMKFDEKILDESIGRQVVNQKCGKCHTLERVYRTVKNKDGWTSTINRMASLDAPNISSFDIKQAIHFLTTRQKSSRDDGDDDKDALNEADGKSIMESKCTVCHESDRVIKAEKTESQWDVTINRMIEYSDDAQYLTKHERNKLIEYLVGDNRL